MSPSEAFRVLLPQELTMTEEVEELQVIMTVEVFQKAFASIYYDCSDAWNKKNYWAKVETRDNDGAFCKMQAISLHCMIHSFYAEYIFNGRCA